MQEWINTFEKELYTEIMLLPVFEVEAKSIILKENVFIKEIPLLIEGSIKVRKTDETGKEVTLYHINPGESCILSITSCLNDKQSNAEAIVEIKSRLIVISADKVKEYMDKYKSWRKFVQTLYYTRLEELLTLVDLISFKQIDFRLLEKLKELQSKQGEELRITHQTLANEIGTAREVISRLLKQLEKQGIIQLDRGLIKIIKPL